MKKLVGRIYRDGEDAFFLVNGSKDKKTREEVRIALIDVLKTIQSRPLAANKEIIGQIGVQNLLRQSDIDAARLYIHRYGYDLDGRKDVSPKLLLDECVPVNAVVPLSQTFGFATHIDLEGLGGKSTSDRDVWDYATQKGISALLTKDEDFLGVSRHRGAEGKKSPFLIVIRGRKMPDLNRICKLFEEHAGKIRSMMVDNDLRGCSLSLSAECKPLTL